MLALLVSCATTVPTIDISPLLTKSVDEQLRRRTIQDIGEACMYCGFFQVVNHGVDESLQNRLEQASRMFFTQPRDAKRRIEMAAAGMAWRGYFEVGEELTSGAVDEKEGLYFARSLPGDQRPLHGPKRHEGRQGLPAQTKPATGAARPPTVTSRGEEGTRQGARSLFKCLRIRISVHVPRTGANRDRLRFAGSKLLLRIPCAILYSKPPGASPSYHRSPVCWQHAESSRH